MTDVSHHAVAIERAIEAIEISPDGGFWWCGERADWYPARFLSGLNKEERRALTLNALADCLYENFYRNGRVSLLPSPTGDDLPAVDLIPRRRLADANVGSGSWQPGWEVIGTDGRGWVRVRRDGLTLTAMPDEVRLVKGQRASIKRPRNMYALSPGFHTANLDAPPARAAVRVRLYWHVVAAGAESFLQAVTRRCNEVGIGGSLKVVNDRSRFDRCDSAVVYLSFADVSAHHDVISSIHSELVPYLRPETSAMTLALAQGLAIAQDPGNGLSFGQHRTRLIAEAAIRRVEASRAGCTPSAALSEVFASEGISWEHPYSAKSALGAFTQLAGQWNSH